MLPDRVSNPGPLTYESGALPIALRGPAKTVQAEGIFYGASFHLPVFLARRGAFLTPRFVDCATRPGVTVKVF